MSWNWKSLRRLRLVVGLTFVCATAALVPAAATVGAATSCPCSLFDAGLVPVNTGGTEPHPVELGVKFTVDVPVRLTSMRFYKDPAETGSHVARLWTAAGSELAQATFHSETPSGWQETTLATPVVLSAGVVYVASVGINERFVMTHGGLASSLTSGPLRTVDDGANGVYAPGIGVFPTSSYAESNYFVDVVVEELEPPTATLSPADGATGVAVGATISAVFSREMDAATLTDSTFTLEGPGGTAVPGSVAYDPATRTATLTPAASLANGTMYTARLDETVAADDGVALGADLTWVFTIEAAAPPPPLPPAAPPAPAPAPDPHADVALAMTASPGSPSVGSDVTYTLTATNLGPATATGVVVEDYVPAGIALASATTTRGSCTTAADVRCAIGSLAPGASARITIAVSAVTSGDADNVAHVSAEQPDPNSVNNRASSSLVVAVRVLPVAEARVRVSLVRTALRSATARRAARSWVAVDSSQTPIRPLRLQLAADPERPWSWRSYLDRFSFRSARPEIWIRLSDDSGTVTEWQAFRFAAAVAARSGR